MLQQEQNSLVITAHPGLNPTIRNSICILKVKSIVITTATVDTVE